MSVKTPLELKEQFGAVVRSRRMGLQISQEELAGRAGLHRTYIADIERGARNPSLESIDRLARALEVSIAGLFAAPATNTEAVDILLVEDDANDVVLTLRAFDKAHLSNRVQVAKDGAEALAYIFCTGPYASRRAKEYIGKHLAERLTVEMVAKHVSLVSATLPQTLQAIDWADVLAVRDSVSSRTREGIAARPGAQGDGCRVRGRFPIDVALRAGFSKICRPIGSGIPAASHREPVNLQEGASV